MNEPKPVRYSHASEVSAWPDDLPPVEVDTSRVTIASTGGGGLADFEARETLDALDRMVHKVDSIVDLLRRKYAEAEAAALKHLTTDLWK